MPKPDEQPLPEWKQVALSPETVNRILRDEPALLLHVKELLIRKAGEQGRILDPVELTDNAVFLLVRESQPIRAMASQEIIDRGYLKLRPSKEETEKEQLRAAQLNSALRKQQAAPGGPGGAPSTASPRSLAPPTMAQTGQGSVTMPSESDQYQGVLQGQPPAPTQIHPGDLVRLLGASQSDDKNLRGTSLGSSNALGISAGASPGALSNLPPEILNNLPPGAPNSLGGQNLNALQPRQQPGGFGGATGPGAALQAMPPRPPGLRERSPYLTRLPNPYANVPSLYDLYTQASVNQPTPERFGMDIFQNGTGNLDQIPMDLPVGPDYMLGSGDGLKIELWGGVSQRLQRVVDSEGRVTLPEVGPLMVAGHTLGDVQREVKGILRTQFRDVEADVSITRLRSVRVYVVGDTARPGPYDISALSTPLNALYYAGGPSERGSFRTIYHYRGKRLLQTIDNYDLILRGVGSEIRPFQPGDSVLVPPVGSQVTIEGMIRRPAIYELKDEKTLAEVLELAGGVLPTGTLRHIEVERVIAHQERTMLSVDLPATNGPEAINKSLQDFRVQDGDRIRILPILPYSEKTVYLDGHVFRPGKYTFHEGMAVTDLIHDYSDLLPEPARMHAEIIRLNPPDFRPTVVAFHLADALGHKSDLMLQPFDTVRVFSRYDFEDPPTINVFGEVRNPGEHLTNGETHLRDAIYLAGGVTPDAELDEAQVYRSSGGSKLEVISVSPSKAMAGDPSDNILLQPKDRIVVHRNLAKVDPPTVYVQGEVAAPGKYPLAAGMTASELVRAAGGFKRSAYTEGADLSRYDVQNGQKVIGKQEVIEIGKAMAGDTSADVALKDGDVLAIRQLAGWKDLAASITVKGEVLHPGTYGIREGERLSSVLKRTGGFQPDGYPQGAVLERLEVRDLATKSREELVRRIEASGQTAQFGPDVSGKDQAALLQAMQQQQQQILAKLRNEEPTGRLVINISPAIKRWENTPADIQVRAGDVLSIPKKPAFVLVSGAVYNTNAITFAPGRNVKWYLRQAGGITEMGKKNAVYVIRADGSVITEGTGGVWWKGSVMNAVLQPGDMVVVPEKLLGGSSTWKNLLGTAQVVSSLAIAARVATSF